MCKVHNPVGSLTTIKSTLARNKIEFTSIQDLISFQNNYSTSREQLISAQRFLLTEERNNFNKSIVQLEKEIENDKKEIKQILELEIEDLRKQYDEISEAPKSVVQEFTYSFKALFILIKRKYKELVSNSTIVASVRQKEDLLTKKREQFQYLNSNFEDAVTRSGGLALQQLDHKKRVINEINSFIYGTIGEEKVVDELSKLSDEYTLINDFYYYFPRAIYYPAEKSYIRTIQIDHLLISPAGIFLIETKNWSKESLTNLNLFSPVQQIKRTSFALFKLLADNTSLLGQHHWGDRKIPIKNLIVLINHKPTEEFQHVKVLTLNELLGYIGYFKPSLSNKETKEIAKYLIEIGN